MWLDVSIYYLRISLWNIVWIQRLCFVSISSLLRIGLVLLSHCSVLCIFGVSSLHLSENSDGVLNWHLLTDWVYITVITSSVLSSVSSSGMFSFSGAGTGLMSEGKFYLQPPLPNLRWGGESYSSSPLSLPILYQTLSPIQVHVHTNSPNFNR